MTPHREKHCSLLFRAAISMSRCEPVKGFELTQHLLRALNLAWCVVYRAELQKDTHILVTVVRRGGTIKLLKTNDPNIEYACL